MPAPMDALEVLRSELEELGADLPRSAHTIVFRYGRAFEPHPLPGGIPQGREKDCYFNACMLALDRDDFTYVEGFALPDIAGPVFPVEHAWCIDAGDRVVDLTWRGSALAYLGIAVPKKKLARYVHNAGSFGLLPNLEGLQILEELGSAERPEGKDR